MQNLLRRFRKLFKVIFSKKIMKTIETFDFNELVSLVAALVLVAPVL